MKNYNLCNNTMRRLDGIIKKTRSELISTLIDILKGTEEERYDFRSAILHRYPFLREDHDEGIIQYTAKSLILKPKGNIILEYAEKVQDLIIDRTYERAVQTISLGNLAIDNLVELVALIAQDHLSKGQRFVRAIREYMYQHNVKSVSFDPSSYGYRDDIPFCRHFNEIIDTVSIPENQEDAICICVYTPEGAIFYENFDGTEDEDFDYLFHEIYYELKSPADRLDASEDEAEDWLAKNNIIID